MAVNPARQRDELVTIYYVDLDGFKPVNDEHGHDVGDKLLTELGRRLRAASARATSCLGSGADSADGLLRRTDASMFEAKRGALGSR